MSDVDQYAKDIARHPLISRQEETRLALAYQQTGDQRAAHKLITANLRFVLKVAHEFTGYGLDFEDLVQEGNLGLIRAVEKFDPSRGFRLVTYAVWWIRAHISKYVMANYNLVKIGTTMPQRALFFKLRSELDAGNSPADIGARFGMSEDGVREMRERLTKDSSLDTPLTTEALQSYVDVLENPLDNQEEKLEELERWRLIRQTVRSILPKLSEKERVIIRRRLLAENPSTLADLSADCGVCRERMRQIEVIVMDKLRKKLGASAKAA